MVWGMVLPSDFGAFWPSGDFEYDRKTGGTGWYARLREYYARQTPEEQKRLFDFKGGIEFSAHHYGTFPSYKFTREPGASSNSALEPSYGSIEPHEIPRSFTARRNHTSLGSLIMLADRLLAVDQRLKELIEWFEPDLHEFFPFALIMPGGVNYPNQYYILRICQYFDSFSRAETWEGSIRILPPYRGTPELVRLNKSKEALNGLAMDKSIVGNAHLWRDRTFKEELTCFSDALMAEIKQAGLRLPKHFRLKDA